MLKHPPANASTITLHALRAAGLPLADTPPTRLVVMPWGVLTSRVGSFTVDGLTAAVFRDNQNKMRLDGRLALDFEHNTLEGTAAYKASAEPRPVAAWGLASVVLNEGIVFDDLQWTPEGLSAWNGKLYQDISPAPFRDKAGRVIALHSAALCRHGELEGLTIHAAASPRVSGYLAALSAQPLSALNSTPTPMKEALLKLLTALGVTLADSASDEEITAALNTAAAAAKPAVDKPDPMSAQVTAQVTALSAEFEAFKKQALLDAASAAGKVIPLSAEQIVLTPLSVLSALCAAAVPGAVPLTTTTTTQTVPGAKPDALSAETLKLAAQMGLTPEEVTQFTV